MNSVLSFLLREVIEQGLCSGGFPQLPSFQGQWLVRFHCTETARSLTSSPQIKVWVSESWFYLGIHSSTVLLRSLRKYLLGNECGPSHFSQESERIIEVELGKR